MVHTDRFEIKQNRPIVGAGVTCRVLVLSLSLLAGTATSQGTVETATQAAEKESDRLAAEVYDLELLQTGRAPEHFPLPALFETDLLDDQAVARRIEVLQERLGTQTSTLTAMATSTDTSASLGLLYLERDRLRLAFLRRPRDVRSATLEADRSRRALSDQRERAQRESEAAVVSERASELSRQQALEAARIAENAAKRALAAERARAAGERAALAATRRERAQAFAIELEGAGARQSAAEAVLRSAARENLAPAEADQLYDELVAMLSTARKQLAQALDQLTAASRPASQFRAELDLDGEDYRPFGDERRALSTEIAAIDREARALETEEHERWYARSASLVAAINPLNDRRIALLERVSKSKRHDVLGIVSRAGLAQLGRELEHVRLMIRWYPRAQLQALRDIPAKFDDLFDPGRWSAKTTAGLLLFGASLWTRRRHRAWIERLKALSLGLVRRRPLRLQLLGWFTTLAALFWPVARLLFLYSLFDGLIDPGAGTELNVVRNVAIAWGWYQLAITAIHHAVTSATLRARGAIAQELSAKIFRSIRVVGRYVLAVAIFLILSSAILGKGYLHQFVVGFAWLGALPIGYLQLRWWRTDIADAYLRAHPSGRLANWVVRTRERSLGLFVAAAAFAIVAGAGATAYARQTLLGFEQTRKALAFLFRRRLERQQERRDGAESDAVEVPAELARAFSETPADPSLAIDRYPRLGEIVQQLNAYHRGERGGSAIAVVGEAGAGKTSWLDALARRAEASVVFHAIEVRITTESELCSMLAEALVLEKNATIEDLIAALRSEEKPRAVLLDLCHNLVLRAVGGFDAYRALEQIVSRTSDRVFWVCAFAKRPFVLLQRAEGGRNVFREAVELTAWTEEEIGELIERRMQAAGSRASYEDLIVERMEGTDFNREVVRTASSFRRLLWDYADGNPRVALHFWLRSLVPAGPNLVRVRLFSAPRSEALDDLEERTSFVLAALVQHENITAGESERFLRYPIAECESALRFLEQRGYVFADEGRYRVTTRWYRTVLRFLRRKNLLFT